MSYAAALVLTLVVEAPVWALLGPLAGGRAARVAPSAVASASTTRRLPSGRPAAFAAGSAATLVTHAALWFVAVPALRGAIGGSVVPVLVAEAGVCLAEGLLVAWWLRGDRFTWLAIAVLANAASLVVGFLLW